MPKPDLKIAEPREPYNTKEDLFELAQEYKRANETQERSLWELSDLAHEAADKYGLKEFAKATGENYNSLIAYSAMAGVYPKSIRTYSLTYRHYMVAKSSDSRLEWLEKAEKKSWSAERLRREMNPPKEKPLPAKLEPVIPTEPNPVAEIPALIPAQTEPEVVVKEVKPADYYTKRSYEDLVEAMNYFYINDKRSFEMAIASDDFLIIIRFLYGEERTIVFNQEVKRFVII